MSEHEFQAEVLRRFDRLEGRLDSVEHLHCADHRRKDLLRVHQSPTVRDIERNLERDLARP